MNSDGDLDTISDERLSEVFAIEVAGFEKRTEGLLWDEKQNRAFIIGGSSLHDIRKKMGLPCDTGIIASYATDANAVLPWIETKLRSCDASHHRVTGLWTIEIDGHSASSPSFARTACIALIRSERSKQ